MLRKCLDIRSAVAIVFTATLLTLKTLHFVHTVVTINSDYLHKSTNSLLFIVATVSVSWRSELEFEMLFRFISGFRGIKNVFC